MDTWIHSRCWPAILGFTVPGLSRGPDWSCRKISGWTRLASSSLQIDPPLSRLRTKQHVYVRARRPKPRENIHSQEIQLGRASAHGQQTNRSLKLPLGDLGQEKRAMTTIGLILYLQVRQTCTFFTMYLPFLGQGPLRSVSFGTFLSYDITRYRYDINLRGVIGNLFSGSLICFWALVLRNAGKTCWFSTRIKRNFSTMLPALLQP